VAGLLAIVGGLPQLGIAIFIVIVLNGVFAFAQEYRAERAALRLRDLLPRRVTVIRDGERFDVDASELVVGDLVALKAGDRISADLRTLQAHAALVDTSALTGESVPSAVDEHHALFAGTFLVEGEVLAEVTATGGRTRLAGIAQLAHGGARPTSPLALELQRVVRTIASVSLAVGLGFFGIALLIHIPARDGFLFAIGVTVALVPEGLLPTVTLSLAVGAQRMAHQHALIRRLEAVETLGSTTFICTDKTGTLTRSQMSVVEVWTPAGVATVVGRGYEPVGDIEGPPGAVRAVREAARSARRCSTGRAFEQDGVWAAQGDPIDAAVDVLARRAGASPDDRQERRRFPFDPRRRLLSVVVDGEVLTKGAPDAVLPRCRVANEFAATALREMTERGLRVIGVAKRALAAGDDPSAPEDAERDLELLALFGLLDPPRPEARAAIEACRHAGIRVAMITGDHPATAAAIAEKVGLLVQGAGVYTGAQLPEDEQLLGALVDRDGIVIARVDPEHKLRIARALHARGHVVAMTGDGVNDGPALQEADIGVAMGASGTDVAREASDLVLLDDNFATIVAAVEQGRSTYANIRRFLTYHLTDNVAELTPFVIWALSGGTFPLAIGVMQVLALDIGTDALPAIALGAELPDANALDRPPIRRHLLDGPVAFRVFGVLGPTEAVVEMAAFVACLLAAGWRPGAAFPTGATLRSASGAAFAAVVFGQVANAFACRSVSRPPWRLGWTTNRLLVAAAAAELVLAGAFLLVPPLAHVLTQAPPTALGWTLAVCAAPAVIAVDATHKALRRRRSQGLARP
jgi:magnesium-transporting ATPase (P-type)